MILDQVKYKRQQQCKALWVAHGCTGVIEAATGFGKTLILIDIIKDMNIRHPDRISYIIVPNTNLKQDWEGYKAENKHIPGHIELHKLMNTRIFVINTYVKYINWSCDLLAIDEIHRVLNEDASEFSKVLDITKRKFFIGLTATLDKKKIEFLELKNLKVIDKITQEEATKNGWMAPSNTFNLAVKLKQKDVDKNTEINDRFRSYFSRLNHEFEFVKACNARTGYPISVRLKNGTYLGSKTPAEWRSYIAQQNGYNGNPAHTYSPENIAKYAAQAMYYMGLRKTILQNYESKIDIAETILNKYPDKKILVFCETSKFADTLYERCKSTSLLYHTNLKTLAIKGEEQLEVTDKVHKDKLKVEGYSFIGKSKRKEVAKKEFNESSSKNHLITVRALDEGADFKQVDIIMFLAYNSTERQRTQREGRGLRIDYTNTDKRTLIIFLYVEGTQEEKWLNEAQKNKASVRWIKSIDEITLDTVKLGSNGNAKGIVSASTIRIIGSTDTEGSLFKQ